MCSSSYCPHYSSPAEQQVAAATANSIIPRTIELCMGGLSAIGVKFSFRLRSLWPKVNYSYSKYDRLPVLSDF